MSATVTIFNANPLGVQISVNNGPQFSVPGANAPGWAPASPAQGGPGWSNTSPAPNVMAPGENYLTITPAGMSRPFTTVIGLARNTQWTSLQIYVFFNGYSDLSWIVLNNGQFVTGGA